MTEQEFEKQFGMKPELCKEIMKSIAGFVEDEVHEIIRHADFYMSPKEYYYPDEHLEKENEDDDGYTCLYDFLKEHSAEEVFMRIISFHTHYGGQTSAIEACNLMGLEWKN